MESNASLEFDIPDMDLHSAKPNCLIVQSLAGQTHADAFGKKAQHRGESAPFC